MSWTPKHSFPYTWRLTIAYDGTEYSGWQIQPQGTTIQGELVRVLSQVLQCPISVIGSGRTDAGVHATAQVAHFRTEKELEPQKLLRTLNGLLRYDIRILHCEQAPAEFHALYTAQSKEYHYHLWLDPVLDPTLYRYRWHIQRPLDQVRLQKGLSQLLGTHDFSALANENNRGAAGVNACRTLTKAELVEQVGGIRIELASNGFLYKMVRNIVGTLVNGALVGSKRPEYIDHITEILQSKDRRKAGKAAPAKGLFLHQVTYSFLQPNP